MKKIQAARLIEREPSSAYDLVVRSHIIDGERWIVERLAFLREMLAVDGLTDDQRQTIEHEIEALSRETGIKHGGRRASRRFRWFGRMQ